MGKKFSKKLRNPFTVVPALPLFSADELVFITCFRKELSAGLAGAVPEARLSGVRSVENCQSSASTSAEVSASSFTGSTVPPHTGVPEMDSLESEIDDQKEAKTESAAAVLAVAERLTKK